MNPRVGKGPVTIDKPAEFPEDRQNQTIQGDTKTDKPPLTVKNGKPGMTIDAPASDSYIESRATIDPRDIKPTFPVRKDDPIAALKPGSKEADAQIQAEVDGMLKGHGTAKTSKDKQALAKELMNLPSNRKPDHDAKTIKALEERYGVTLGMIMESASPQDAVALAGRFGPHIPTYQKADVVEQLAKSKLMVDDAIVSVFGAEMAPRSGMVAISDAWINAGGSPEKLLHAVQGSGIENEVASAVMERYAQTFPDNPSTKALREILKDPELAKSLRANGLDAYEVVADAFQGQPTKVYEFLQKAEASNDPKLLKAALKFAELEEHTALLVIAEEEKKPAGQRDDIRIRIAEMTVKLSDEKEASLEAHLQKLKDRPEQYARSFYKNMRAISEDTWKASNDPNVEYDRDGKRTGGFLKAKEAAWKQAEKLDAGGRAAFARDVGQAAYRGGYAIDEFAMGLSRDKLSSQVLGEFTLAKVKHDVKKGDRDQVRYALNDLKSMKDRGYISDMDAATKPLIAQAKRDPAFKEMLAKLKAEGNETAATILAAAA